MAHVGQEAALGLGRPFGVAGPFFQAGVHGGHGAVKVLELDVLVEEHRDYQ